jgi:hypothetical protein
MNVNLSHERIHSLYEPKNKVSTFCSLGQNCIGLRPLVTNSNVSSYFATIKDSPSLSYPHPQLAILGMKTLICRVQRGISNLFSSRR